MSRIKRIMNVLTCIALCLGTTMASSTDTPKRSIQRWYWIRVEPNLNPQSSQEPWLVLQGTADMEISDNGKFHVTFIHEDDHVRQRYRIEGQAKGNNVIAEETLENSDANPLTYRGTLSTSGSVPESRTMWISLRHGAYFIGLRSKQ